MEELLTTLSLLHESKQRKIDGTIFYAPPHTPSPSQSASPYRRSEVKTGRNDPCVCGSGKKFKRCCGGV